MKISFIRMLSRFPSWGIYCPWQTGMFIIVFGFCWLWEWKHFKAGGLSRHSVYLGFLGAEWAYPA